MSEKGEKVYVCPECGARSDESRSDMFSGWERVIRIHDDWLECKKCGHSWDKDEKEE